MHAGGEPVNVHFEPTHAWGTCEFATNHTRERIALTPKEELCAAFLDQVRLGFRKQTQGCSKIGS
jgi:hypothetical protein